MPDVKIEKDLPAGDLPNPNVDSGQKIYPNRPPYGQDQGGYPQPPQDSYPPQQSAQQLNQLMVIPILIPMAGISQPVVLPAQAYNPAAPVPGQYGFTDDKAGFQLPIPIPVPMPYDPYQRPPYGYPPPPPPYGYPPPPPPPYAYPRHDHYPRPVPGYPPPPPPYYHP